MFPEKSFVGNLLANINKANLDAKKKTPVAPIRASLDRTVENTINNPVVAPSILKDVELDITNMKIRISEQDTRIKELETGLVELKAIVYSKPEPLVEAEEFVNVVV